MADNFNKGFLKDYQFWSIILSVSSLIILGFFACQTYKLQDTLKAIEETRQKEKFSNNFHITFKANPSKTFKAEEAEYALKLHNKSTTIYKSLETNVTIIFENEKTREIMSAEAFSFPPKDIIPSNEPISLMKNIDLTKTIQFNILEYRKNMPASFEPKYFFFQFEWQVEIGEKKILDIIKGQTFVVKNLL